MAFYGCDFIFDGKRASTFLQPSNPNISYKRLMLYSIGRFLIEFLRDDIRGSVGVLSASQFIGLFIFAAGLALLFRRKRKENHGAV